MELCLWWQFCRLFMRNLWAPRLSGHINSHLPLQICCFDCRGTAGLSKCGQRAVKVVKERSPLSHAQTELRPKHTLLSSFLMPWFPQEKKIWAQVLSRSCACPNQVSSHSSEGTKTTRLEQLNQSGHLDTTCNTFGDGTFLPRWILGVESVGIFNFNFNLFLQYYQCIWSASVLWETETRLLDLCQLWFVDIQAKDLFYLGNTFICQTLQIVPFMSNKACCHSSPCSLNVWMLFHLSWHKTLGCFQTLFAFLPFSITLNLFCNVSGLPLDLHT